VLDHLSAGDVNGEPGWITYTQWLNDDGRIEADLTVSKLATTGSGWSPPTPRTATSPACSTRGARGATYGSRT
jgi:glycine cleavage system aminomethyltransferase T